MTKQDKPWVVEEKTTLGMLPKSRHSSITKVLGSFPKRLSGFTSFSVKAGNRIWRVHKENVNERTTANH